MLLQVEVLHGLSLLRAIQLFMTQYLKQQIDGNFKPKQRGKPQKSHLTNAEVELRRLVAENHDATIVD